MGVCLSGVLFVLGTQAAAADPSNQITERVVARHLAHNARYVPGDLLSREDVEPILDELADLGFRPFANDDAFDMVLPESSLLVILMRMPEGERFMRRLAHHEHVYDRLERLTWSPQGRDLLRAYVASPHGVAEFEKLLALKKPSEITAVLGAETAKNFELPTAHIHTALEFVQALRKAHGIKSGSVR
jgi:hypothetical protein